MIKMASSENKSGHNIQNCLRWGLGGLELRVLDGKLSLVVSGWEAEAATHGRRKLGVKVNTSRESKLCF